MYRLEIKGLSYFYRVGPNSSVRALSDVNIHSMRSGEICFLLGPNGAGKSTILNILARRIPFRDNGEIRFYQENRNIPLPDLRPFYLPQSPHLGVVENLNLLENLLLRRSLSQEKFRLYSDRRTKQELQSFLKEYSVDFLQNRLGLLPARLSGGELQMLALLSILFANPPIILMDEPTSKLDERHRVLFMNLLCQAIDKNPNVLVICATHDLDMANRIGNRHIWLDNGMVVREDLIRTGREARAPGHIRYIKSPREFPYPQPANDWWDYRPGSLFAEDYFEGDDSRMGYLANRPLRRQERTEREVTGIIRLLGLDAKRHKRYNILDVPCGWGRHSLSLARRGFWVEGIDLNEQFVQKARREAEKLRIGNVSFRVGDMRDILKIYPEQSFDLILNLWTSFGFFGDEQDKSLLCSFYRLLRDNGRVLIHLDLNPKRVCQGIFDEPSVRQLTSGRKLFVEEYYCEEDRSVYGVWRIEGANKAHTYKIRVYDEVEWNSMANYAGFKHIRFLSSFDSAKPLDSHTQELIVVLEK